MPRATGHVVVPEITGTGSESETVGTRDDTGTLSYRESDAVKIDYTIHRIVVISAYW
jgi:hypothetical protein